MLNFVILTDLEGIKSFGRKIALSEISDNTFARKKEQNGTWISGKYHYKFPFISQMNKIIKYLTKMFRLKEFTFFLYSYQTTTDTELIFRDASGGLSILNLMSNSIKELMNNATFVSIRCL